MQTKENYIVQKGNRTSFKYSVAFALFHVMFTPVLSDHLGIMNRKENTFSENLLHEQNPEMQPPTIESHLPLSAT